ncbi:MAG: 2-C-methyl-D-erythritol 4-phosphate cytidylyltransferase, partial [Gammaproteobacteria bacterium]
MARCQDSKYWAVVPAAGIGRRVGGAIPKQYLEVAGAPIISHTLSVLCSHPSIEQVVVVLAPDDPWWPVITSCSSPKPSFGIGARAPLTATGGKERCHSVLAGVQHLRALASGQDWVLVHDAARPCLAPADIDELISSVSADDAGGLLAAPVGDTLKQVGEDGYISSTVDRTGLWRALTPQ